MPIEDLPKDFLLGQDKTFLRQDFYEANVMSLSDLAEEEEF